MYKPNGVINTNPHKLMSALMRLGLKVLVSFLPITAYAASHSTAQKSKTLPSHALVNVVFVAVMLTFAF